MQREGVYNKSAIHIDVVGDFRLGGARKAVYLDDTALIVENGVWKISR
jgi:hypothetical protein